MKARIKIGYKQLVLPFEDAVVLIRTLENTEFYETEYVSGQGTVYYLDSEARIDLSIDCMTEDEYAVMKMRGPKPTKE